jgi:hypothetical protein
MLPLTLTAILSVSVLDGLNAFKGGLFSLYFWRIGRKGLSLACPLLYTALEYSASASFLSLKLGNPSLLALVLVTCAFSKLVLWRYHLNLGVRTTLASLAKKSFVNSVMDFDFLVGGIVAMLGVTYFALFIASNVLARYLGSAVSSKLCRTNVEVLTSASIVLLAVALVV